MGGGQGTMAQRTKEFGSAVIFRKLHSENGIDFAHFQNPFSFCYNMWPGGGGGRQSEEKLKRGKQTRLREKIP